MSDDLAQLLGRLLRLPIPILDVREPASYLESRIRDSVNIAFDESFERRLFELPPRHHPLLVLCDSRSVHAFLEYIDTRASPWTIAGLIVVGPTDAVVACSPGVLARLDSIDALAAAADPDAQFARVFGAGEDLPGEAPVVRRFRRQKTAAVAAEAEAGPEGKEEGGTEGADAGVLRFPWRTGAAVTHPSGTAVLRYFAAAVGGAGRAAPSAAASSGGEGGEAGSNDWVRALTVARHLPALASCRLPVAAEPSAQALWAAVEAAGAAQAGPLPRGARRVLFQPCAALAAAIDRIERALAGGQGEEGEGEGEGEGEAPEAKAGAGAGAGGFAAAGVAGEQAAGARGEQAARAVRPLRCLDLGCGQGRDSLWLALRGSATWSCVCVDDVPPLLAHLAAAARAHAVVDRITPLRERVRPRADGGVGFDLPPPQVVPIQADSAQLAAVAAGAAAAAAAAAAPSSPTASPPAPWQAGGFDLLLCARFHHPELLAHLPSLVAPGGFVVYTSFAQGASHPAVTVLPGQLAAAFSPAAGFTVLQDAVLPFGDGRPMAHFVARRLRAAAGVGAGAGAGAS